MELVIHVDGKYNGYDLFAAYVIHGRTAITFKLKRLTGLPCCYFPFS
jgi:hypothetical protein